MVVLTGATGQLGRLVIHALRQLMPPSQIIAAVRDPEKAKDLAAHGVQVRHADYTKPETLPAALTGADKLLLISSSAVGQRVAHHRPVIDAARRAGVGLVAYTSALRADTSPLGLAAEHLETERLLHASGLPLVLLRNGWYTENYAGSIQGALAHGAILGSAGSGRIAAATRADFAAAAAAVLTRDGQAGRVYELAGDAAFTMPELAAEVSRQSGKTIVYKNLPEAEYQAALIAAGLPEVVAALLADSDVGISQGGMFDDGRQLSRLIGRATTPLAAAVTALLKG